MAQKNTLQYILLGLLAQNDMAGYDIKKLFDTEISDFWHANHSQIYPELRRLEAEGYIEATTEIVGEKLEKHRYHITEKGYPLLNQWMGDSLGKIPPSKDEFPIKAYLISDATDPMMTALIDEEVIFQLIEYFNELNILYTRYEANYESSRIYINLLYRSPWVALP